MKRRYFLGYSLLFLGGCTGAKSLGSRSPSPLVMPNRLRFTVTDAKGLAGLREEYEPFRVALEEMLQTSVEFFAVDDYFMAASALQSGQLDLAWAGPSEYVAIRARTNAIPLVSLVRSSYRSLIVVRGDSGIRSLRDLKGKTIDMWKLGSTAGQLGAVTLLAEVGLNPRTDITTILTKDNSLEPLKTGLADAWARPWNRYISALKQEKVTAADYPILAEGKRLPGDVFVLSSRLGSKLALAIQERLINQSTRCLQAINESPSLAERFSDAQLTLARDEDYEVLRQAYRLLGQDDFLQT